MCTGHRVISRNVICLFEQRKRYHRNGIRVPAERRLELQCAKLEFELRLYQRPCKACVQTETKPFGMARGGRQRTPKLHRMKLKESSLIERG